MQLWQRNDETGVWDVTETKEFSPEVDTSKDQVFLPATVPKSVPPRIANIAAGIVFIKTWAPDAIRESENLTVAGFGLLIDAKEGLIITSKSVVPHSRCHVMLHFGQSLRVRAKVGDAHPMLNAILLRYDPSLVGDVAQQVTFSEDDVEQGEKLSFLGINEKWECRHKEVVVTTKRTMKSRTGMHIDYVNIDETKTGGGLLVTSDGSIKAQWFLYGKGMLSKQLVPLINDLREKGEDGLRMLDVELETIGLETAGELGVNKGMS